MKRILGRLKLWQKIVMIVIGFTLPICCLAFFVFREYHRQIDFGQMERFGTEYQRPLQLLLERLPQHDNLSQQYLAGDKLLRAEISNQQQEIDRAFEALEAVDRKLGAILQFTAEGLAKRKREQASPVKVKQRWQELKTHLYQLPPEAAREQHLQLLAAIRTMITHCGDMSQLILDPDLDSYYLMNDTVVLLPQAQDRLGAMITEAGTLNGKAFTKEKNIGLAKQLALLQEADLEAIVSGTQTAVAENKSLTESATLQHNIPSALKDYSEATERFLATARQVIAIEKGPADLTAYIAAAEQTRAASFNLWNATVAELDLLLEQRINHYRHLRLEAALATGIAATFLFACVFFLIKNLNDLIGQVRLSGVQVNTSMHEMAATSKEQQATAAEIAATTAEIGATSKQIAATADELVKTVSEVNQVAEQTAEAAAEGQTSLTRMEGTIQQIMGASSAIASKLAVLNDKAGNINTVVTTITKVADQTNLLSLNAAIEAEKAGEHGRGFAVVATEIRRLADQTAVGTYDITQMVKEMQSAVAGGVMGMEKFSDEVRKGAQDVTQVASQLAQIIHQVQALTPRFERVNEGMQSQATGARQISEALTQLSEAAQQTVESLHQSNQVIERLNEAARGLDAGVTSLN